MTYQHVLQQYRHDDQEYHPEDVGDHWVLDHGRSAEEDGICLKLSNGHDERLEQRVGEIHKLLGRFL